MTRSGYRLRSVLLATLVAVGVITPSVAAAEPQPQIRVTTLIPEHVVPGEAVKMWIAAQNTGDAPMSGNLTVRYVFPSGLTVADPRPEWGPNPICTQAGAEDICEFEVAGMPPGRVLPAYTESSVEPGATGILTGEVQVSGGGAPNSLTVPLAFDTSPIGPFDVKRLSVDIAASPPNPSDQAGADPSQLATGFETNSYATANFHFPSFGVVSPPESLRNVVTHVPAGLVGNPTATAAKCTAGELAEQKESPIAQVPNCPRDSQVGVALVNGKDLVPVYNLVPPMGTPASFGLVYQKAAVRLNARLRPSDNGIDLVGRNTPSVFPISQVEVTFWGSPASSSHDVLRGECTEGNFGAAGIPCPAYSPVRKAFLRLPTSCSAPLTWSIEMDTYQNPGVFHSRSTTTPALTGCGAVPFEPDVSLAPTDSSAHSASGLDVDLSVPQDSGPDGISSADVRRASLTLPQGVGLNPAAAEGLEACSDAQLRLGLEGPAECPDASKLGSVEVDTPLLEEALDGSVYLRTQNSRDPGSGQMYRLAIVLHSAQRGVDVKLPGSLVVNKDTGRLTTAFDELPQLPFETMHLHLKAGPRAPLTTPPACGSYSGQATLEGWNGKTVSLSPGFSIDQACSAPGFSPGFEAGVGDPTAGEFAPFTLRVTREAGMPNVSSISAILPEGELAKLAGVPLCPDAQAVDGDCPASSQIGRTVAAVGEGPAPIYLPQPGKAPTAVYLAGPYKGAPLSVIAAVPAQSGPFDLGTVVVRSALRIDPETVQATVASDPLPQIFGGIPVSYRDVRVIVDRPGFTVNPTDCEPMAVRGEIGAISGARASVSDRFQVGDCAALSFKPKLSLKLSGETARAGNPALTAVLRMPQKGASANVARTAVVLPRPEFVAQDHLADVCTRVQYAQDGGGGAGCPGKSVYGRAIAYSPLLDHPLVGRVYLRSNGGARPLPDLVASLGGQIHVDLVGWVSSDQKTGGLKTTFAKVPDAPVARFVLKMGAGRHSLLENSTDICRGRRHAKVRMVGQNGAQRNLHPKLRVACRGRR